MPGAVGLAVIDSFASGTPLLTTDIPLHGPEIAYLQNGINGVVAADDVDGFVGEAVRLLTDDVWRRRLAEGCAVSARRYTLDNMIGRFAEGVSGCLDDGVARPCASC
jgi:glycosyltransferase involved in cell wall biosynthesis